MKKTTNFLLALSAIILWTSCQTSRQARIVRLSENADSLHWLYSVNGGYKDIISSNDLTNRISELHLHHGDIILFGTIPTRNSSTESTLSWLSEQCDTNRVATYLALPTSKGDIFSTAVYHWTAPYDLPTDLRHACFFYEGSHLGDMTNGFSRMLHEIEVKHAPQVFVLGSLYNQTVSWGPGMTPFENGWKPLDEAAKKAGTDILLPHPLLGF